MATSSGHTTRVNGLLARLRAIDSGPGRPLSAESQTEEQQVLDALLSVSYERLQNLTRKMLGNYERLRSQVQTDDVLHTALLKLVDAVREVRPPTTFAFIGLAALQIRRTLLDLAKRPAPPPVPLESDLARPDSSDFEPELWAAFHEAVPRLEEDERVVFEAFYYLGWTQSRIAEECGLDPKTVAKRLRGAKRNLVRRLSEQGFAISTEL